MQQGVETDIATGKPRSILDREKEERKAQAEKLRLEDQASYMGLAKTPPGQALIAMVFSSLQTRIEQLIAEDPAAAAYCKILKEMGMKEGIARKAAKILLERYATPE
jgi:hypothetical protein